MLKILRAATVREEFKDKVGVIMSQIYIISSRLREMRKKRGLTQSHISEGIGISRSAVTNWELGIREPNALEMRKLCEFFSVSSDYLCGRTDNCTTINIPKVYNIDVSKLNALGKRMLFEFYDFLVQNETYAK